MTFKGKNFSLGLTLSTDKLNLHISTCQFKFILFIKFIFDAINKQQIAAALFYWYDWSELDIH